MMSKRNTALLFLLLLQVVIIGFVYRPGRNAVPPEKNFFQGIEPAQVVKITVRGKEGRTVTLNKENNDWRIAGTEGLPADNEKIATVVDRLTKLSSNRLIAQTSESHNRFLVGGGQYNLKVTLGLADGREKSLYLGTAPTYKSTHVRAEDDDRVYLATDLAAWQMPAEQNAWWRREYVDIPPDQLTAITLKNGHGTLELVKDDKNEWQIEGLKKGQKADAEAVKDFVETVSRIALTEYLGRQEKKEFGLARPLAVLTLGTQEETVTLAVGSQDQETNTNVVKSSNSPFYVRAGSLLLAPVLERQKADLLAGRSRATEQETK